MAKSDYRPGRRRRAQAIALLDCLAGMLLGCVLTGIGLGVLELLEPDGATRATSLLALTIVTWPIGAALGVWLAIGRPLTARGFGSALVPAAVATGLLSAPLWLGLSSELLRGVAGVATLILVPVVARVGSKWAEREI